MGRRDPLHRHSLRRFNDAVHNASQQMLDRNRCGWRLNPEIGLSYPFIDQSPGIPSGVAAHSGSAAVGERQLQRAQFGRHLWAAAIDNHASSVTLRRNNQVRSAFDLLNVVSGNLSPPPTERTAF